MSSDDVYWEVAVILKKVLNKEKSVRTLVYQSDYLEGIDCDLPTDMRDVASGQVFGTRTLNDESRVFEHNAWDNMPWNEEMDEEARRVIEHQKEHAVNGDRAEKLLAQPANHWDLFYSQHSNKFFMDRNWLFKEFPELDASKANKPIRALEVGCGVGNTTFPVVDLNMNHPFFLYSCDFSPTAIKIMREHEKYNESRISAFVWDITLPPPDNIPSSSLDIVICIFVLSAIEPTKLAQAVSNLASLLKPGGCLLLKDYGRFDLAQLRFKNDRLISDNLYCRGDGTLVYFFTEEELDDVFEKCGLKRDAFVVDRRLIVNRAKRVKMQRVWLQAKYVKPITE